MQPGADVDLHLDKLLLQQWNHTKMVNDLETAS